MPSEPDSQPQAQDPPEPGFDHAALLREIDAEVQRRRAAGDLTPEFERELDMAFADHAPAAALGGDLDSMLDQFEHAAFIDVDAPVESARPGGAQVKLVLRKAMAFNFRHIAYQVGAMGQAQLMIMRAMRDEQLRHVRYLPGASEAVAERIRGLEPTPFELPEQRIIDLVGTQSGRVAVIGAGDGALVVGLRSNGVDAYGVEADLEVGDIDEMLVRRQGHLAHLERLAPEVLSVVVLVMGAVPLADALRSIDLALPSLVPGGRILLVSEDPATWESRLEPVQRDLAIGRPLSPETWSYLMAGSGMEGVNVALLEEVKSLDTTDWPASLREALEPWLLRVGGRGVYVVEATRSSR